MAVALIVEDDANVLAALASILTTEGFRVIEARSGGEALTMFAEGNPDLVVLDIMLPDGSGFDVCRQVRATSAVPVLMLTALTDESSVVQGFYAGADDYVGKPFRPRELVARVRSILKRVAGQDDGKARVFQIGDMAFYPERQVIEWDSTVVSLSPTESELLAVLASNAGHVLQAQEIVERVWRCHIHEREAQDLVKTAVSRLRGKVEPDRRHPRYVLTVRGKGYALGG